MPYYYFDSVVEKYLFCVRSCPRIVHADIRDIFLSVVIKFEGGRKSRRRRMLWMP